MVDLICSEKNQYTSIRWGASNVLAVRVYDDHNQGGLSGGSFTLKLPEVQNAIDITLRLEDSDGIFFPSEPLHLSASFDNHSNAVIIFRVTFDLTTDRIDSVQTHSTKQKSVIIKGKSVTIENVAFPSPPPGFYSVVCRLNEYPVQSMLLGYEPEKIVTPLTRPPDFQSFWDKCKNELSEAAPQYNVIPSDRSSTCLMFILWKCVAMVM